MKPLNKDIPKTHIPRSRGNHIQSKYYTFLYKTV